MDMVRQAFLLRQERNWSRVNARACAAGAHVCTKRDFHSGPKMAAAEGHFHAACEHVCTSSYVQPWGRTAMSEPSSTIFRLEMGAHRPAFPAPDVLDAWPSCMAVDRPFGCKSRSLVAGAQTFFPTVTPLQLGMHVDTHVLGGGLLYLAGAYL